MVQVFSMSRFQIFEVIEVKRGQCQKVGIWVKFIYSEATKFCEISTLLLSYVVPVKSKVEILQNFVAFSEYMNFNASPNLMERKSKKLFFINFVFQYEP